MKHLLWVLPFLLVACSGAQTKKTEADKAAATAGAKASEAKAGAEKAGGEAKATAEKAEGGLKVVCKNGKEERTLEVAAKGAGCELKYTKGGEAKSVASGAKGLGHCENTAKKMRGNLEGAGYKCE